jgi:3-oxoacyl-[acyl-carrier-protein] synthase II
VPEHALPHAAAALSAASIRRLSHPDRLALAAAAEACRHAGLEGSLRERTALAVGTTTGGMGDTEEAYRRRRAGSDRRFRLSRFVGTPQSTAGAVVSQALGVFGPRLTLSTACSSSALALGVAADLVRRGDAPVALVVGTDAFCRLTCAGFGALQAVDPEPCRPFDRGRRGLSLGEGAGALVLERRDHAQARGATVLALLRGWGVSADAHHVTAPDPDGRGAETALRAALTAADLSADRIDYVNAHGSGTRQNDAVEVAVLRRVFGARLGALPVSSSKSQIGHTLGAAGALEAIATVVALTHGVVPPTVSLREPEWPDLDFVPVAGRRSPLAVAASSSYGFGGHDVTLILSRADVA